MKSSLLRFLLTFCVLLVASVQVQATSSINFGGNSAEMYEKVCAASPFFVRSLTRNAILKEIERQGHQELVTESAFYQVIREVTPAKFLEKTLAILDRHKSE